MSEYQYCESQAIDRPLTRKKWRRCVVALIQTWWHVLVFAAYRILIPTNIPTAT
jgi:hypothetical protein